MFSALADFWPGRQSRHAPPQAAAADASVGLWTECTDCGLRQSLPMPQRGIDRRCERCDASFGTGMRQVQVWLALTVANLMMLVPVFFSPLIRIFATGRESTVSVSQSANGFFSNGDYVLGSFVYAVAVLFPTLQLSLQSAVLFGLTTGGKRRALARPFLWSEFLRPWAMLDVMLLAIFVTISKVSDSAQVQIQPGLWALAVMAYLYLWKCSTLDRREIWDMIRPPRRECRYNTDGMHWTECHSCHYMNLVNPASGLMQLRCERCHSDLHHRKPNSVHRTAALVAASLVLYVPANYYPVLTVIKLGHAEPTTIIHGVRELLTYKDWPYAVLVFLASIVIPLAKLAGLSACLLALKLRNVGHLHILTRAYRGFALIGRWSVLDVYVAALSGALVAFGNLASILPGPGLLPFAAVVIMTMVALDSFDPRLMWDAAGQNADPNQTGDFDG